MRHTISYLALAMVISLLIGMAGKHWTKPGHDVPPGAASIVTPSATSGATSSATSRPGLTVTTERPARRDWPIRLTASGGIAAWQDISLRGELGGLRIVEVKAGVGAVVTRGQVLAVLDDGNLQAQARQQRAAVEMAEAALVQAQGNERRALELRGSGALADAETQQFSAAAQSARAQLKMEQARLDALDLKLRQTRVVAPDNAVVSVSNAVPGNLADPGVELFRLVRQGRLEWRAEVPEARLGGIKPGSPVEVRDAQGATLRATVREIAPTIDPRTRNGLVHVDLAAPLGAAGSARPGMFVSGVFDLGAQGALTIPDQAVIMHDGYSYVFTLAADSTVTRVKVRTGRRGDGRIEIVDGLGADATVVTTGAGLLGDGDRVAIASTAAATTTTTTAPAPLALEQHRLVAREEIR